MPVKKCLINGKSGFKFGDKGKCYTGPGAKKKAIRQGMAEHANANDLKNALSKVNLLNDKDAKELLDEMITKEIEENL